MLACQFTCLLCSHLREAASELGSSATVLGQAEVVEHQRGEDRLVVKGPRVLIEEMCPEIGAQAMIEQERLTEVLRQRDRLARDRGVRWQDIVHLAQTNLTSRPFPHCDRRSRTHALSDVREPFLSPDP